MSKQVRAENVIPEEQLLRDGYSYSRLGQQAKGRPVAGVRFSQAQRDRLPSDVAEKYVGQYMKLCVDLIAQGFVVDVVLDEHVSLAGSAGWEQSWRLCCDSHGQVTATCESMGETDLRCE